tara:strand:+ start:407 stop:718 length:312 start_codon:yes stop_codon:yes gene_type:complete
MSNEELRQNPFQTLSNSFIENQRNFNMKVSELRNRLEKISDKTRTISNQLNSDPFSAQISALVNFEEEAHLMLIIAKDLEKQRDDILSIVELLTKAKETKLND